MMFSKRQALDRLKQIIDRSWPHDSRRRVILNRRVRQFLDQCDDDMFFSEIQLDSFYELIRLQAQIQVQKSFLGITIFSFAFVILAIIVGIGPIMGLFINSSLAIPLLVIGLIFIGVEAKELFERNVAIKRIEEECQRMMDNMIHNHRRLLDNARNQRQTAPRSTTVSPEESAQMAGIGIAPRVDTSPRTGGSSTLRVDSGFRGVDGSIPKIGGNGVLKKDKELVEEVPELFLCDLSKMIMEDPVISKEGTMYEYRIVKDAIPNLFPIYEIKSACEDYLKNPLSIDLFQKNATEIPALFNCTISLDIMKDPVVASDGHIYDRDSIMPVINSSRKSPFTREPITSELRPVPALKKAIELFKRNNAQLFKNEVTAANPTSAMGNRHGFFVNLNLHYDGIRNYNGSPHSSNQRVYIEHPENIAEDIRKLSVNIVSRDHFFNTDPRLFRVAFRNHNLEVGHSAQEYGIIEDSTIDSTIDLIQLL